MMMVVVTVDMDIAREEFVDLSRIQNCPSRHYFEIEWRKFGEKDTAKMAGRKVANLWRHTE